MIIIRIQGGLGNQLFQYAACRSLAEKFNTVCKLDLSSLHKNQLRRLDLDYFNTKAQPATAQEIKQFVFFPKLYRHSPAFFSKSGRHIYREPHFHFDNNFNHLTNPVYLDGYFQSEKYFNQITQLLKKELVIKNEFISHLSAKANELSNTSSVSVHIRRGDYTNKKMTEVHGMLSADYYDTAIETIAKKYTGLKFYFFSDDITWVKQNLRINHPHEFISGQTKQAIEDFYLMTQCCHNIIANSSFSWWAAWLNNNTGKTIIAPKKWFNKESLSTKDLIPQNWKTI